MRHPTTGLSEDDLSRLTGSSSSSTTSSASTTPSHNTNTNTNTNTNKTQQQINHNGNGNAQQNELAGASDRSATEGALAGCTGGGLAVLDNELVNNLKNSSHYQQYHKQQQQQQQQQHSSSHFNSSYLPEFIDPLEWQKSRKRKERLDSTSSTTQDRKLIRSNSEELLPNSGGGDNVKEAAINDCSNANQDKSQTDKTDIYIRRVSSEDFKRSATYNNDACNDATIETVITEQCDKQTDDVAKDGPVAIASDENDSLVANRHQQESSPPPFSPGIDRPRRSRFETSPARSHHLSPNRNGAGAGGKYHRESDDSECEHERRRSSERFCKSRAPPGRKAGVMKKSGKYLPTKMRGDENTYKYDVSALKYERRGFVSKLKAAEEREREQRATSSASSSIDYNDNNLIDFHIIRNSDSYKMTVTPALPAESAATQSPSPATPPPPPITTAATEPLPWDCSIPEDQTPILSRRFASVRHPDCIDTAAKLSKVMPYPQPFHKQQQQATTMMLADDILEPINTFRAFTSLENLKTREVMQQVIPAMMSFQSPEERLKQVNKRLTALKRKIVQLEEVFETKHGYRPSQAEKVNDKHMKNVLAEISKLRKEKHELKSDPMGAVGLKVIGGMDPAKKLEKMKETLIEIEQNLSDKREDGNRSEALDELTADQLVQEKTAVQHGLLYFESLYGRPSTKEERDAARSLYDRYRILKRMVSRSVTMSGCALSGVPELPTILEHEAMVFESIPLQYSNSTDTTNSPSESATNSASASASASGSALSAAATSSEIATTTDDSTSTADLVKAAAAPQQQHHLGENIHTLSIDELWEHLDKAREEKKLLKRTIREYETVFEEQNGRKMLKNDRKSIEDTYAQYKEKKAKTRLLQALIKKQISR